MMILKSVTDTPRYHDMLVLELLSQLKILLLRPDLLYLGGGRWGGGQGGGEQLPLRHVVVGGGGCLHPGRAAVLHRVEAHPAAADVADWAALTARAPVALTAGLALGLGQTGGVRPALTLRLRPAPGQSVSLLHHHRPSSCHSSYHQVRLHFDTRKSVSITITKFSPPVPVLISVLPLDGVLVLITVLVVVFPVAGSHVVGVGPALRLYAGPVQGDVPASQPRGGGQRPRSARPRRQGVGGPVTPGHGDSSRADHSVQI